VATEDMPVSNASSLPRASSEEAAGSAANSMNSRRWA
jgi:hypothetical protein